MEEGCTTCAQVRGVSTGSVPQSNCHPLQGTSTACPSHICHICLCVGRSKGSGHKVSSVCLSLLSIYPSLLPCPPIILASTTGCAITLRTNAVKTNTSLNDSSRMIFFLTHFDSIRVESEYWHSYICILEPGAGRDQVQRQNTLFLQSHRSKVQAERD